MRYKAALVVGTARYQNNRWFSDDPYVIRDDMHGCYIALKNELCKYDIDLSTEDINRIDESDIVLQMDVPREQLHKGQNQKTYLILNEPAVVRADNWDPVNHNGYDRIFTWNDALVDNKRYFLLRMAYKRDLDRSCINNDRKKLCTMIVGYKFARHRNELYSERLAAINWFTRNHPEDFEFYGAGWPKYLLPFLGRGKASPYNVIETRIPKNILESVLPGNTSYGGEVVSKHETLSKYMFSICYENAKDLPGFITEKIFDSFSAGCVPIYWGASNVHELIPPDCFIDKRAFGNYEKLYDYMSGMDSEAYSKYLENIDRFLKSDRSKVFSPGHFAGILTDYIVHDQKGESIC